MLIMYMGLPSSASAQRRSWPTTLSASSPGIGSLEIISRYWSISSLVRGSAFGECQRQKAAKAPRDAAPRAIWVLSRFIALLRPRVFPSFDAPISGQEVDQQLGYPVRSLYLVPVRAAPNPFIAPGVRELVP